MSSTKSITLEEQFNTALELLCKLYGYDKSVSRKLCSADSNIAEVEAVVGYSKWIRALKEYCTDNPSSRRDYMHMMMLLHNAWKDYLCKPQTLEEFLNLDKTYIEDARALNSIFASTPYRDLVSLEDAHISKMCCYYGVTDKVEDKLHTIEMYSLSSKLRNEYSNLLPEYIVEKGASNSFSYYVCKYVMEFSTLQEMLGALKDIEQNCIFFAVIRRPKLERDPLYTFVVKNGNNIVLRTFYRIDHKHLYYSWLANLLHKQIGIYNPEIDGTLSAVELKLHKYLRKHMRSVDQELMVAVYTVSELLALEYTEYDFSNKELSITGKAVVENFDISNDWVTNNLRQPVVDQTYKGDSYYQWVLDKYAKDIPVEVLLCDELNHNIELSNGLSIERGMDGLSISTTLNPSAVGRHTDLECKLRKLIRERQCLLAAQLCDQDYQKNILPTFKERLVEYITNNKSSVVERLLSGPISIDVPVKAIATDSDVQLSNVYTSKIAQKVIKYPYARSINLPIDAICITHSHAYVNYPWLQETPTSVIDGSKSIRYSVEIEIGCANALKQLLGLDDAFLGDMIKWDGFTIRNTGNIYTENVEPVYDRIAYNLHFPTRKIFLYLLLTAKEFKKFKLTETN